MVSNSIITPTLLLLPLIVQIAFSHILTCTPDCQLQCHVVDESQYDCNCVCENTAGQSESSTDISPKPQPQEVASNVKQNVETKIVNDDNDVIDESKHDDADQQQQEVVHKVIKRSTWAQRQVLADANARMGIAGRMAKRPGGRAFHQPSITSPAASTSGGSGFRRYRYGPRGMTYYSPSVLNRYLYYSRRRRGGGRFMTPFFRESEGPYQRELVFQVPKRYYEDGDFDDNLYTDPDEESDGLARRKRPGGRAFTSSIYRPFFASKRYRERPLVYWY